MADTRFRETRWLHDPVEPNWRLVLEGDDWPVTLAQEKTTSTKPTAQALVGESTRLYLLPADARWLHEALGRLIATLPDADGQVECAAPAPAEHVPVCECGSDDKRHHPPHMDGCPKRKP